ncbi:hypothetical protein JCM9279_000745 [Rhodotorula babjevae]
MPADQRSSSTTSTTSASSASAPPTVKKPQTRRPAPLSELGTARPRSFSVCPPPSPPAFAENALDRPASTAPGRRSAASNSSNEAGVVNASFQSIDIVLEPPSRAASSRGSRTPSPVGPRLSAAIPIRAPTYFARTTSPGKCFQEQIQPLVYFDVQHPSLFDNFGDPYPAVESASHYPGYVAPLAYGQPIPYYEVYPDVTYSHAPPPSPSYHSHAFDPSFALVQPPSPFAPHPTAMPAQGYEPTPYPSAWTAPNPYLEAPSPAFVSPPASPGLSIDGTDGASSSAQQQAKPALAAIESTTGVVYPLVPSAAYPVVPTMRELLARGEHFFSSGTCKFFDVLKGYGFLIDDHSDLGADVFVHYTGIDVPRGFRCLSEGERVEYVLTNHSAGGYQALRVVGEAGAPLKGLTDERNAKAVCRSPYQRQSTPVAGAPSVPLEPASTHKPKVVPVGLPPKPVPLPQQQQQINVKLPMHMPQPRKGKWPQASRAHSRSAFAPRAA